MRMCGFSDVLNADVDAGKDPHFTHASDMPQWLNCVTCFIGLCVFGGLCVDM